jgi:hypothetical protein
VQLSRDRLDHLGQDAEIEGLAQEHPALPGETPGIDREGADEDDSAAAGAVQIARARGRLKP